jgi:soluble lytic murein transglycosylase-like protein
MALHKLVQSILLCLLLVFTATAQDRHEPSLQERARQLEPFIIASAQRYGIDAGILRALCFIESRYRIEAISPKGARGPMQFMPETAARYGLRDPHDPRQAIDAAARYLRDLLKRFGGRVDLTLAAYNAGEGVVTSFITGKPLLLRSGKVVNARGLVTGGIPPYLETQEYVHAAIALLRGGSVSATKSKRNVRSKRTIQPRDFTIDALSHRESVTTKATVSGPASFIEIQ